MESIFNFLKESKDLFTSIGIIATFFVSILSLWFTTRNNKAIHYVNSVTQSRVEWIDKLRKNISDFISLLDTQDLTDTYIDVDNLAQKSLSINLQTLIQIGTEIKLMLNFSDKFDNEIMEEIDIIIIKYKTLYVNIQQNIIENQKERFAIFVPNEKVKGIQDEIDELSTALLSDMQIYLKSEWNRVKNESQGKTYEKDTQLFDLEELKNKKSNTDYKNDSWKRFCINTKAFFKRLFNSEQFLIFIILLSFVILLLSILSNNK